jgi:hypothetical protein
MTKGAIMKSLVSLLLLSLLVGLIAPNANAARIENDGKYVYYLTPWTDAFRDKEQTKFLFGVGLNVLKEYLTSLIGVVPQSDDDFRSYEVANEKLDSMLENLNQSMNQLRSHSSLSAVDAVPTALLVYGGTKISANLKIGAGGSISLGLVMMPVRVQKVDKFSREVVGDPEVQWRFAPIFWLSPEVGTTSEVGVKVAPKVRVGGGFIWSRTMSDPSQFSGYGASGSRTFSVGPVGLNLKVGFVNNTNLKDYLDTVYAIAGYESGLTAGQSWHLNGTAIYPLSKILTLLNPDGSTAAQSAVTVKSFQDQFNKMIQQKALEIQSQLPGSTPASVATDDDVPPTVPKKN